MPPGREIGYRDAGNQDAGNVVGRNKIGHFQDIGSGRLVWWAVKDSNLGPADC